MSAGIPQLWVIEETRRGKDFLCARIHHKRGGNGKFYTVLSWGRRDVVVGVPTNAELKKLFKKKST